MPKMYWDKSLTPEERKILKNEYQAAWRAKNIVRYRKQNAIWAKQYRQKKKLAKENNNE